MKIAIASSVAGSVDALSRALAASHEHSVVWSARTATEAVALCATHTPELLLLDLAISGIGGVEATRRIMRGTPCAILIVANSIAGDSRRVFEAMGAGALDVVELAAFAARGQDSAAALLAKIAIVRKLIGDQASASSLRPQRPPCRSERLVAIGASAGGPAALAHLLAELPADFPAGVVVVQHVDAQFAQSMASWLAEQSAWPVRLAVEGDRITHGLVLLAGATDHLVLKAADRLGYTPEPIDYPYRPSIDSFFQSVTRHWLGDAIGVLLTGMGRDGAIGLKAMRNKGHHTIAQDQSTSAVYGMPKAAAKLEAAVEIVPLPQLALRLQRAAALKR